MQLLYPITPELVTLACATAQGFEREFRNKCALNILQYRILSYVRQHDEAYESTMPEKLQTSASQLSQNLTRLLNRGFVRWEWGEGSNKLWFLIDEGRKKLDDADSVLLETYDHFFYKLDPLLHKHAKTAVRLTGQAKGLMRVRDGQIFDEFSYLESILFAERSLIKATQECDLSIAQFRVLYELFDRGPQIKAHLAKSLSLARSTVTWVCAALERLGYITLSKAEFKTEYMALTEIGRGVAVEAIELADRRLYEMRVWSPEERANNQSVAEHFVKTHCR